MSHNPKIEITLSEEEMVQGDASGCDILLVVPMPSSAGRAANPVN